MATNNKINNKMTVAIALMIAAVVVMSSVAIVDASLEFTQKSFDKSVLNGGKSGFIMFYAPWCGHCKALKPKWEEMAKKFVKDPKVIVGKVNCDEEKELCQSFQITGYPSIKAFRAGDISGEDYNGGRTVEDMESFARGLKPACSDSNRDECSVEQIKLLDEAKAFSDEELEKKISTYETELKDVNEGLENFIKTLQAQYEKAKSETDMKVTDLKSFISLYKGVKNSKAAPAAETESTETVHEDL